jgi:hypothetical protein
VVVENSIQLCPCPGATNSVKSHNKSFQHWVRAPLNSNNNLISAILTTNVLLIEGTALFSQSIFVHGAAVMSGCLPKGERHQCEILDILLSRLVPDCAIPEDFSCSEVSVCAYRLYESKEGYSLQQNSRGLWLAWNH